MLLVKIFFQKNAICFSTFIMFIMLNLSTFSATKTWTVTGGGNWTTAGNWSPSGAPAADDDVIIPNLTNSTTVISNVPQITLGSLTFTGTGYSWLQAGSTGNILTIRNTFSVSSGHTVTLGASGVRIVVTLSTTCIGTLNGYCAFDAGNTNRLFTINGTLIVNSTGMSYDPNPTAGSDLVVNSGATLKTQKSQGFTC